MDEALEDVGESSAKGQRHGLATCALSSVGSCRMVRLYTGKWVDGKLCGLGVFVEANGCMTTGYLTNDQFVCSRSKLVKAAVTVQRYSCGWAVRRLRLEYAATKMHTHAGVETTVLLSKSPTPPS